MMRKGLYVVAMLALVLTLGVFHGGYAQSGPHQDTFTVFASYQFNVLKHPTGMTITALDNVLYIADTDNNVIRSFPLSGGPLQIVAGTGAAGYVDGARLSAQFSGPTGIVGVHQQAAATRTGGPYSWSRLYVNDAANHVLRRICVGFPPSASQAGCSATSTNNVVTLAGTQTQGFVDGTGSAARFAAMGGLSAPSSTGLLEFYSVDTQNHAVRDVNSSGTVTTYCGTGTAGYANGFRTSSQWNMPSKAAWDGAGNMYVTDTGNYMLRKIDTAGNVTSFAGSGQWGYADGSATVAKFKLPTGVAYNPSDGFIYVADTHANVIRKVDGAGNVSTYAGTGTPGLTNGSLGQAQFSCPSEVIILNNLMYVSDTCNNVIRRIDMTSGVVSTYIS
jgi:hypothetical protein